MRRIAALCLGAVLAGALGACGGGGDGDAASKPSNSTGGNNKHVATAPCPLTPAQVSSVLGTTVEDEQGICSFYPTGSSDTPNASFNRQSSLACDDPAAAGYNDEVTGLGVKAYTQPGTAIGTMLLACGDAPFEVTVNKGSDTAGALEAAKELARIALGDA